MKEIKQNVEQPQIKKAKTDEIFTLVKNKEGVKIVIGNYQVSRKVFKSFQAAEDYLNQKPYEILINTTCLFTNLQMQENEKAKTIKADK